MTWLYVPGLTPASTTSASAPEAPDSTSASSWRFQVLEQSVWWRGKPSPSLTWSKRWNKVSWLQRLCGRMPEPSTADAGVEAWAASLVASRASRGAKPAGGSVGKTSAISGRPHGGSSCSPVPGGFSSRTSPECLRPATPRPNPARYGSSEIYSAWVFRLRAAYSLRLKLATAKRGSGCSSSLWQTMTVADTTGGRKARSGARSDELLIKGQAERLISFLLDRGIFGAGLTSLTSIPASLPSSDPKELWPALTASCVDIDSLERMRTAGYRRTELKEAGSPYLARVSGVLNPAFGEWLMGWPIGWTGCACSETELSRFKQRMRSALSQLTLHAAPPAQLSLFG